MAVNAFQYVKNVGKSFGYSAIDSLKSYNPSVAALASGAKDLGSDLRNSARDIKDSVKRGSRDEKGLFNIGKNTVSDFRKNLFDDLKTGKWYNKERIEEADNEFAKEFLGIDLDDFDIDFDEDLDEDATPTQPAGTVSSNTMQVRSAEAIINNMDSVGSKSASAISNATVQSADYIVTANQQSSRALYNLNQKGFAEMASGLSAINSNLSAMVSLAHPLTTHMQNSAVFYTKSAEYQHDVLAKLDILIKNTTVQQPKKKINKNSTLSDLMNPDGTIDLSRYFEFIQDSFKNHTAAGMTMSMFGGSTNGLSKQATASPMKAVTDAVTKTLIPQMLKESMKEFNKALGNFFPAAIDKVQKKNYGGSLFGDLFEAVKDFLIPKDRLRTGIDTSKYNHGQTVWTGESEMALKEVIPTYLSAITAALTGGPMTQYDYKSGQFTTVKSVKNLYNYNMQRAASNSGGDFRNDTIKAIRSLKMDQKTKNALIQQVDDFFLNAFKTGSSAVTDLKNPNLDLSAIGIDKDTLTLLKQVLEIYEETNKRGSALEAAAGTRLGREKYNRSIEKLESENSVERSLFNNSTNVFNGKGTNLLGVDNYGHDVFFYLQGLWQSNWYLAENMGLFGSSAGGNGMTEGGTRLNKVKPTPIKSLGQYKDSAHVRPNNKTLNSGKSTVELQQETINQFTDALKNVINEKEVVKTKPGEKSTAELEAIKESANTKKVLGEQLTQEEEEALAKKVETRKSSSSDRFENLELPGTFGKIVQRVDQLLTAPGEIFAEILNAGQTSLYNMIFGRKGEDEKGLFGYFFEKANNLFDRFNKYLNENVKTAFSSFTNWLANVSIDDIKASVITNVKAAGNWVKNKVGGALGFGRKKKASTPGEGETEPIDNGTAAYGRRVTKTGVVAVSEGELIIPSEYNPFYHGSNNKSKQLKNEKNALNRFYGYFAEGGTVGGDNKDKKGKPIFDIPKLINDSLGKLATGLQQFVDTLFPKNQDDEDKEVHRILTLENAKRLKDANVRDEISKNSGAMMTGALAGAGVSLLTGAVVGPFAGAAIGAGVGLVIKSDKVQKALFGDIDDKTGEREGGILSKEVSNFITKRVPNTILGAGAGAVAGTFMGSPILGAFIGGTVAFAAQSERVKEALFGNKDDENSGLISKSMRDHIMKLLPNVGAGTLAGLGVSALFGGPFGIVGNMLVGSAVGYASTTEQFQDLVLGKRDKNTGERAGGIVGEFRGYFFGFEDDKTGKHRQGIFESITGIFNKVGEEIRVGARNIFEDTTTRLKEMIDRAARSTAGQWLGGTRLGRAVSAVGRGAEKVIKAPFSLAQRGLESADIALGRRAIRRGYNMKNANGQTMTAQERTQWALEHGMTEEDMGNQGTLNNLLAGMSEEELNQFIGGLDQLEHPATAYDKQEVKQKNAFRDNLEAMGIDNKAAIQLEKAAVSNRSEGRNDKRINKILDKYGITGDQRDAILNQLGGIRQTRTERNEAINNAEDRMQALADQYGIPVETIHQIRGARDLAQTELKGRFGVTEEGEETAAGVAEEKSVEEESLEVEKSIGSDVNKILLLLYGKDENGNPLSEEEMNNLTFGYGKFEETTKKCPHCGEEVDKKVDTCPKCGYVFNKSGNAAKEAVDNASVLPESAKSENETSELGAAAAATTAAVGVAANTAQAAVNAQSATETAEKTTKKTYTTDMLGNTIIQTLNEQGEPVPDMSDKETRQAVEDNKEIKKGFIGLAGVGAGITGLGGMFKGLKDALFGSDEEGEGGGLFSNLFNKFFGEDSFLGGLFSMVSGIFGGSTIAKLGKGVSSAVSSVVSVIGKAGLLAALAGAFGGVFDNIVGKLTGGAMSNNTVMTVINPETGEEVDVQTDDKGEPLKDEDGNYVGVNGETIEHGGNINVYGEDTSLSSQMVKNTVTGTLTSGSSVATAVIKKTTGIDLGAKAVTQGLKTFAKEGANSGLIQGIITNVTKLLENMSNIISKCPVIPKSWRDKFATSGASFIKEVSDTFSSKLTSLASNQLSSIASTLANALVVLKIVTIVGTAVNAWTGAESILGVKEATTGQRFIAVLVAVVNALIPIIGNLIPNSMLVDIGLKFAKAIGIDTSSIDEQRAELAEELAIYNEENGTEYDTAAYLEKEYNKVGVVDKVKHKVSGAIESVKENGVVQTAKNALGSAGNWISEKASNLGEKISGVASSAKNKVVEGATNLKNKVVEGATNVKNKVVGAATSAKDKVVEGVTGVATSIGNWVSDKKNKATEAVKSVSDKVVGKITSIGDVVNEEKEYMDKYINDTSIPWTDVFHVEDDPDNPMNGLVKNFRLGVRIGYFAFMFVKRIGKIISDKVSGIIDTVKSGLNTFSNNQSQMMEMVNSGDPTAILNYSYEGDEENPLNGVLKVFSSITKVGLVPMAGARWVGNKISDAIGKVVSAVKTGFTSFSNNQSQMMELVNSGDPGEVLNYTYQRDENDPLGGVFSALSSITKVGLVPMAGVKWLGNKISEAISNVINTVTTAWQTYQSSIEQAKTYALAGDTDNLSALEYEGDEENPLNGVFKFIFGFNKLGWSAVGTVVHVAKSIAEAIGNIIDNVKTGYQSLNEGTESLKTSAFNGDIDAVTGATYQDNEDNPLNGVFSFIFGVQKIFYTPVAAIKHVANSIGEFIGSKVDAAKSDYSVLSQAGDQMGNLAKNGDVSGVMGTTFQSSSDNILGPIYSAIFNIQKIFYAATAVGQKIFGTVGDIVSSVTGWVSNTVGSVKQGVSDAVNGVANGIRNFVSGGSDEEAEAGAGSGIRREPRYVGGASGMNDNFVSQVDGKYRNTRFAGSTVGDIGCGPAVATMLMNTSRPGSMTMRKAIDATKGYQTPTGTDSAYFGNLLSKNGMSADYYSGVDKDSAQNIEAELAMGRPTVLLGRDPYNTDKAKSPFGPTEHYVMATGIDERGNIIVNDPEAKRGGSVYKPDILNNISLGISTDGAPGNDDDIAGLTGGAFNVVDTANSQAVWNYFIGRGFSPAATAGIMGNIYQESGFKPEIIQGGGKGPAAGLFQWENYNTKSARWASMKKFADKRGKDWTDLETQLKYGDNEFTNELKDEVGETGWVASSVKDRYGSIDAFKNLTDYKEATKGFEETFERAGKPAMENRYEAAKQYYNLYSNGGATSTLGSTQVADPYFIKYTLTDTEIKQLANLATQEQGTTKGAAAEASLMANLWERDQGSTKRTSLYDYVRNSGWFAHAAQYMDNGPASGTTSQATIDAVKQVLNEGKRTLPGYVDEHDCWSDIGSVTNNGTELADKKDRTQYQKDVTKIKNNMGSSYTFWDFPDTNSDPFGYTDASKNRSNVEGGYYSLDGSVAYNPNGGTSGSSSSESGSSSSGFSGILNTIMSAFSAGFAKILGGGETSSDSSASYSSSSSGTSGGEGTDQQKELVNVLTPYVGKLSYSMSGPRNPEKGSADCSSTVNWAYKKVLNDSIGDNTGSMLSSSKTTWVDWPSPAVSKKSSAATSGGPNINNLMPGDILLYTRPNSSSGYNAGRDFAVGHVEMYMGDGNRIGHGGGMGPKITAYNSDSTRYIGAKRHNSFITSTPAAATEAASAGAGSGLLMPSVTKIRQTAPIRTGKFRRFIGGASGVDDEDEEETTTRRRRRSSSSSSDSDSVISLLKKILKAAQSIAENTTDIPTLGTTLTNYCQAQLSTELTAAETDLANAANSNVENNKVDPEDDPALRDLMYTLGEIAKG